MKRFIALFLSVFFVFSVSATGQAIPDTNNNYTITTPYEYPTLPGTEEWSNLEDNLAKIEACAVPEELIPQMTTDALLETYLTHPMAVNVFAFDDYNTGFEILKGYYQVGLTELMQRADLQESMLKRYNQIEVYTGEADVEEEKAEEEYWTMQLVEVMAAQLNLNTRNSTAAALQNALHEKYLEKAKNTEYYGASTACYYRTLGRDNMQRGVTFHTIYTPNGTPVDAEEHDISNENEAEMIRRNEVYRKLYEKASYMEKPTIAYNCHSYAWYWQSKDNKFMVWDPTAYMRDGSYYKLSAAQPGAKVYYDFPLVDANPIDLGGIHSAVVVSATSAGASTIYVRSKWGDMGLYEHLYFDCPYYYGYGSLTFWAR